VAIAAAVVGLLLRLVDLGGVGLNSDEAVYAGQSASMAGNPHFVGIFPVVRAHPLLMQMLMSPLYRQGVPDVSGRYLAAVFGVATIGMVYVLGRVLYGSAVGALAAALLAVMPYHVILSRQIMLDGPMTFFATAALTCVALAASRPAHTRWLLAAGACLGLAALSKETAVIMVGSGFVFLSLVNHLWRPLRFPMAGAVIAVCIALSYPLLTAWSGGSRGGQSYLLWQLTRQPNHKFSFYFFAVGGSIGFVMLAVAAIGLLAPAVSGRFFTWRETLLLSWVLVPVVFFQIWPVKGFAYLLPLAPVVAVLAARALLPTAALLASQRRRVVAAVAIVVTVASLLVPTVRGLTSPAGTGLAGSGGIVGGREAGRWVDAHVPVGARFITIGPSMANLIQFYSARRCDALSVSPNPLHRNPSYHPIVNADAELRAGNYEYIVWDAYSARRSPLFAQRANDLRRRFDGHAVHVERGEFDGRSNQLLVVIYAVNPCQRDRPPAAVAWPRRWACWWRRRVP
jgi:4-amino-4-deoxy-L-arabinose transferase-like glycosyltransferase